MARVNDGSVSSSASHSARNSRRSAPGTSLDTMPMKRRSRLRMALLRLEPSQVLEPLDRDLERLAARLGDLVIAPRRPLLAPRHLLALPAGSHVTEHVEAPEGGIDRPRLKPGAVGDVEPVPRAIGDSLKHERRRKSYVTHESSDRTIELTL